MRAVLFASVTLAIALVGCSTQDGPPAATIELSAPPSIDEEFTGTYWAALNYTPPIENPDIPATLRLETDETILEGWFVPEDREPIRGYVHNGSLHSKPARNGDTFLINFFEPIPGEDDRSIDIILVVEDSSGEEKVVSINDARFEIVE